MRKTFHYGVVRPLAWLLFFMTLLTFNAPPAGAFHKYRERPRGKTDRLTAEQREQRAREELAKKHAPQPDVQVLSPAELSALRARGQYRNAAFSGVLPWQRSFRDVNLCNGNLFKSFTDIQVSPARGAGLAFQRTYNSNDERVGPFGVGWTHAYEIRIEEAGNNEVPRTDFFGGKHTYHRDADGLYSPPAYMYDELSSEYENFLANGPAEVLSDTQKGMDGTVKHFVKNGNARVCDSIEDRHGNRTELTYGLSVGTESLLTRVTDPSGRYLEITWTNLNTAQQPAYRITKVEGPFDINTSQPVYTVTYEYNGDFNLWKVHQDPGGLNRTTTYTYTTYTGANGTETGLLASISDPLGHTVSYTYGSDLDNGNQPTTGTVWVKTVTEPSSGGPMTWYLNIEGPGGLGTFNVWVSSAALTYYSRDCGVMVDQYLRCIAVGPWNDVGWNTYWWEYDTSNNVTSHMTAWQDLRTPLAGFGGVFTHNTYGPHGNVLTQSFIRNYAGPGVPNLIGTTTTSYYGGSKYFQKESVTDALGRTTYFDYYASDDPDVGNRGEVKWVRDARYSTTGEQFEYTYNLYGQKLTETNLNNAATQYTYGDAWGNLTQVVQDPGGLARTTTMSYDIAGRVLSSTDPKAQTSTFQYNGAGQPTTATLPGETVTYTYGANGRTQTVADGRGTTTITYENGNDRVASVQDPVTGTISYTYLPTGEKSSVTLPGGGAWTYDYSATMSVLPEESPDKLSRMLLKVIDDQGRDVRYVFDATGRMHEAISNITYQNQAEVSYVKTEYVYDGIPQGYYSRGYLQRIRHTWNWIDPMVGWQDSVLVQNDYTYDNNGNRLTNTISDATGPLRTETYGYDELARLTSVNYGDGQTQTYSFDPMGNRLQKADSVHGTENYTYNAANMLLTRSANAYTNDANGNTLTGGGRTNTWDGQNRLTQCVYNGTTTTHTYGSDGLRRRTVEGATTTDYVLDGQGVVRTLVNNVVDRTYLHGARGPEYERVGANDPVWYLYDGLGSVLGTVDKNGTVVSTRKYDVYGVVRGSTGPSGTKHKFVGSLGHPSEGETGLVYMRARYYDPLAGRFASEDPARHGVNWYAYAGNAPTRFVDPDGRAYGDPYGTICNILWRILCAYDSAGGTEIKELWDAIKVARGAANTAIERATLYGLREMSEEQLLNHISRQAPWKRAMAQIRGIVARGIGAEKAKEVMEHAAELLLILI